jgi:phosphoribosylanthranilate isomerase
MMLSKICGVCDPVSMHGVVQAHPDYIGCILYAHSKRYVNHNQLQALLQQVPLAIKKVAVFVETTSTTILDTCHAYNFNAVQLHGSNQYVVATALRQAGFQGEIFIAIPATAVQDATLFSTNIVTYVLIDTPTPDYGGTGRTFHWSLLENYQGDVPFFLSGGIGPHNIHDALQVRHPQLRGIDMNSRLENHDMTKNILKVNCCVEIVRSYEAR